MTQLEINAINERVAKIRRDAEAKIKKAQEERDFLADKVKEYQAENDRLARKIKLIGNNIMTCAYLVNGGNER